ncbi:hypothetical protein ACLKA7_001702 [Drosophila subpalustris]
MMSLNKFVQVCFGLRHAYLAASRVAIRRFSERNEEDSSSFCSSSTSVRNNKSASAQLAQSVDCDTKLESPEPIQRMVELDNVRSRINELDQRKLRHQEYAEMLKELIIKPTDSTMERLPFKQPSSSSNNMRQSLRKCSSVEEVLQLTDNPEQLANELVKLSWELATEKRKNDVVLESYLELKQEMMTSKDQDN